MADTTTDLKNISVRRLPSREVSVVDTIDMTLTVLTAQVTRLGLPEFCTFEDMFRYEIRMLI